MVLGSSLDIENIPSRPHTLYRLDRQIVITDRAKREGLVEQCYINATNVRRLGHEVLVASVAQERTMGQVKQTRVILHFDKCDKVWQAILPTRKNLLPEIVQLSPISGRRPMTFSVGKPLCILLSFVMMAVEQIFTIQLDQGQQRCKEQGQHTFSSRFIIANMNTAAIRQTPMKTLQQSHKGTAPQSRPPTTTSWLPSSSISS